METLKLLPMSRWRTSENGSYGFWSKKNRDNNIEYFQKFRYWYNLNADNLNGWIYYFDNYWFLFDQNTFNWHRCTYQELQKEEVNWVLTERPLLDSEDYYDNVVVLLNNGQEIKQLEHLNRQN